MRATDRPSGDEDLSAIGVGRACIADEPWIDFVDPAGRLVTKAKVLSGDSPCILLVKFEPNVRVDPHSHPYDAIYLPLRGQVDFNDPGEPPLREGHIRWVRAGHVYGPEIGGPDGADVLIVSVGGPISIDWASTPAMNPVHGAPELHDR